MAFTSRMKKSLKYQAGMNIQVEVIIDPDGEAYKLDGFHDIKTINPITQELIVDPAGMEQISLYDLQIEFNDPNEFFCPSAGLQVGYTPFRSNVGYLKVESTATQIQIQEPNFFPFRADDYVVITDGNNSEKSVISSVDNGSTYQIVNLSTPLENIYAIGSVVTNDPIYGKQVLVQVRAEGLGVVETQTIYRGVTRKPFTWMNGSAILYVDNILAEVLNRNLAYSQSALSASPTDKIDNAGSFVTTIEWTTQTGSGVYGGLIFVKRGAKIGRWSLTFTSSTDYDVIGPGVVSVGTTGSNFDDNQLTILALQWSGTPAIGDVLEFNINVNYSTNDSVSIIYDILKDNLSDDELIDADSLGIGTDTNYTFNQAYLLVLSEAISISFNETITIGEALIVVAAHIPAVLFQNAEGKIAIDIVKSDFTLNSTSSDLGDVNVKARDIFIGQTLFYNEFIINYAYSYESGSNQFQYIYPETDSENPSFKVYGVKRSITIDVPGIYTKAMATKIAKRHYLFWAFGRKTYTTSGDIREVDLSLINSVHTMTGFDFGIDTFEEKVMGLVKSVTPNGATVQITTIKQDTTDPLGAWS